jgi:hypothetical protein
MASASSLDKFVFLPKIFVDPPAIPKRILHFEHHQRSPLQTRLYLRFRAVYSDGRCGPILRYTAESYHVLTGH